MKSKILPVLFAIIIMFTAQGCGQKKQAVTEEVRNPVKLSTVRLGQIKREISFTGTFRTNNQTDIMPKVSGRISYITVDDGDLVRKGQILIKQEDDDLAAQVKQGEAALFAAQARLRQAQSGYRLTSSSTTAQVRVASKGVEQAKEGVQQAKSSYDNAVIEYDRMKNLYQKGAISKQALDNAETQFEIARSRFFASQSQARQSVESLGLAKANTNQADVSLSEINAAQAGIAQAAANLEYLRVIHGFTTIRSPIDGFVVRRNVNAGNLIAPGDKTPPLVLADNNSLYLESDVPESDISGLQQGDPVTVTVSSLKNKTFKGRIKAVVPSADPLSRTFLVKVAITDPPGDIKNGMSAKATADAENYRGVVIPRHWMKIIEGEYYVVLDKEGKAAHHKVVPGYYNEEDALIEKGLKAGDRIITVGQETLKDGDLLDIQGDAGGKADGGASTPKS